MSTEARILIIGKYKDMPKYHLNYPVKFYDNVDDDTIVIGQVGEAVTKSQASNLAMLVGCNLYDFNTHHITRETLPDMITHRIGEWDDEDDSVYHIVDQALEKNLLVIFDPDF